MMMKIDKTPVPLILPNPQDPRLTERVAGTDQTGAAERESVDAGLPEAAAELTAAGRRPYLIPRGGATGTGAVGYALAAIELQEQLDEQGIEAERVVVAVGSGGTLAGLVAGNVLLGRPWTLVGGSVSRPG